MGPQITIRVVRCVCVPPPWHQVAFAIAVEFWFSVEWRCTSSAMAASAAAAATAAAAPSCARDPWTVWKCSCWRAGARAARARSSTPPDEPRERGGRFFVLLQYRGTRASPSSGSFNAAVWRAERRSRASFFGMASSSRRTRRPRSESAVRASVGRPHHREHGDGLVVEVGERRWRVRVGEERTCCGGAENAPHRFSAPSFDCRPDDRSASSEAD